MVQLGLLLNARASPAVIPSPQVTPQLKALRECGWLSIDSHRKLDNAYAQLSHARLQAGLVDDSASLEITPLLNITQALCDEILG